MALIIIFPCPETNLHPSPLSAVLQTYFSLKYMYILSHVYNLSVWVLYSFWMKSVKTL